MGLPFTPQPLLPDLPHTCTLTPPAAALGQPLMPKGLLSLRSLHAAPPGSVQAGHGQWQDVTVKQNWIFYHFLGLALTHALTLVEHSAGASALMLQHPQAQLGRVTPSWFVKAQPSARVQTALTSLLPRKVTAEPRA